MPIQNRSLHGNAPDSSEIALLLVDVINDFEFPEGEQLLRQALPIAHKLLDLKRQAKEAGIPVIYINDNFGRWRSDFTCQVKHCLEDGVRGQPFVELLAPDRDDYFVLKPKRSGFYGTPLELLLEYLEVQTIILTGIAGNICVLFTANDAYLREFKLIVPSDCIASNSEFENQTALEQMQRLLGTDTRPSTELDLRSLSHRYSR